MSVESRWLRYATAAALAVPFLASMTFAYSWFSHNATQKSVHIVLNSPSRVGENQMLEAGRYEVKIPLQTSSPQVQFIRDGNVVATVPAKVQSQMKKNDYTEVEINTARKTPVITSILPSGLSEALVFSATPAQGG